MLDRLRSRVEDAGHVIVKMLSLLGVLVEHLAGTTSELDHGVSTRSFTLHSLYFTFSQALHTANVTNLGLSTINRHE